MADKSYSVDFVETLIKTKWLLLSCTKIHLEI